MLAIVSAAIAVSCEETEPVNPFKDVTANNIAGTWQLVERCGELLMDGTYVYVDFVRKEKKFTIYQNIDSIKDVPHVITGIFNILQDDLRGEVICGKYDYDGGNWAHDYEVNELTDDSMIWVATDDPSYVQKYVRIDNIPENIKGMEE